MSETIAYQRNTYMFSLLALQKRGFVVETVIEIGAAEGAFFLERANAQLFPSASHFFIDARQENEESYRKLAAKFGASYEITALSCIDGEVVVRLDPDFYNTHVDHLQPATTYGALRRVPVCTLDGLVNRRQIRAPYIIMLDVQGGELDVLRGAVRALDQAVIVTTEIQIFTERDTLVELLAFMQGRGWVLYDITDQGYYPSDSTLCQCYATFIPGSMDFRKDTWWCRPDQEEAILDGLRARRTAMLESLDKLAPPP